MKRKFNFKWMLPALGTIVFLSCGSENEYEMPAQKNEQTATLKLEITGEFPSDKTSDQTRALSFNTALNIPSFINEDGVTSWKTHCFLRKAGTTTQVYALIDWTATTAADGSITLNTKTSELTLLSSGSSTVTTPQAGETWYIAGIAGDGNLNADRTKVDFKYDATKDDALEAHQARVPLSFGWTPFVVAAASGERAPKITVTFRPQGSLLKVTVNNTTAVNSGQFGVSGPITVTTNALTTDGAFDYTPSTTTVVEGANPTFSFASATAVEEVITRNATVNANASKAYVLWGYPRPANHLASGSFSTVTTIPPYRTYNSTAKTAAVTRTRAYANAIGYPTTVYVERPIMPIEYVTEYNLAGGTYSIVPNSSTLITPANGSAGNLRWAASHANNESAYYNWFVATGITHTQNPSGNNLMNESITDETGTYVLSTKYHLPSVEEWWGVFPAGSYVNFDGTRSNSTLKRDPMVVNGIKRTYSAQFSDAVQVGDDAVVYALRFQKASGITPYTLSVYNEASRTYELATNNGMVCAYRYRRVGAVSKWEEAAGTTNPNEHIDGHYKVDVVYLGESSMTLQNLASQSESWWANGISRVFPACGYLRNQTLLLRGAHVGLISSTRYDEFGSYYPRGFYSQIGTVNGHQVESGVMPVRLFKNSVE